MLLGEQWPMRLRNRREARSQTEPSNFTIAGDGEVDSSTPVTWSVDQLNALGPVTGPSHRTFVRSFAAP